MDTTAVAVALGCIVLSLFTVVLAFWRGRVYWKEWRAAENEKLPGPQHALELQTARDLFVGQMIRVVGYAAIFLIFASFLTEIFPGFFFVPGTRAGRVLLTAVTLVAFFLEENFLIRAKNHWAETLRKLRGRRNGGP